MEFEGIDKSNCVFYVVNVFIFFFVNVMLSLSGSYFCGILFYSIIF